MEVYLMTGVVVVLTIFIAMYLSAVGLVILIGLGALTAGIIMFTPRFVYYKITNKEYNQPKHGGLFEICFTILEVIFSGIYLIIFSQLFVYLTHS